MPEVIELNDLELLAETEQAFGVLPDDGRPAWGKKNLVWLPKSLVEYDKDDGAFVVPRWLAEREGLV